MSPLVLAALALVQPDAAHRFAPPLDMMLRYETWQDRDDAGAKEHFRLSRTIRFGREGAGYLAEVTTIAVDGGIASGAGAMFEAAMGALKGVTMRLHLDADGKVTAIDDQAALMARLRDAIVAAATAGKPEDERAALAQRLGGALTAMPEPLQREMLGSVLSSVIADADTPAGASPAAPVTQRGSSPFGGSADLAGTRRSWIDADGRLVIEETLSGTARSTRTADTAGIATTQRRTVDRATGLVLDSRTTRTVTIGDQRSVTGTGFTLTPAP